MKQSIITVSGDDAFEFLQGQLSNDLARLDSEPEIAAAWCNPKGRVLWFGRIAKSDGGFVLSAPAETAEIIVQRLTVFRFRARVEFEVNDAEQPADAAALVAEGIPWIGAAQMEQFTPHMLNLDLLDAISLDKGCYTGQEIIARTHYRGATKRRTHGFESSAAVAVGDKVNAGGRAVGEVLNVAGDKLLAVVPTDAADDQLVAAGARLTPVRLPYA